MYTNIYTNCTLSVRICFIIIWSLAERAFGIDLRCQGTVNSGLFTSFERVKMPKRTSDKPKSRFKNMLAIILKQILSVVSPADIGSERCLLAEL